MIEHYRRGRFDHPVLNLSSEATMSLFDEMDAVADDLHRDPWCVEADLQIAFRQLQQRRRPDLSDAQCLDLFSKWRDHYRAQQDVKAVETSARVDKLWAERDALFSERTSAS